MPCILCDMDEWFGWMHDRANWETKAWRRAMVLAHTDWVLRMRPLPAPDQGSWTDKNVGAWEGAGPTWKSVTP